MARRKSPYEKLGRWFGLQAIPRSLIPNTPLQKSSAKTEDLKKELSLEKDKTQAEDHKLHSFSQKELETKRTTKEMPLSLEDSLMHQKKKKNIVENQKTTPLT
ncbi:MAG: hypothetical protein D6785_09800, partial [Planctomycetota bacterium]